MQKQNQQKLNEKLLKPAFSYEDLQPSFESAKIIAEHYAKAEGALAVLSNMATNQSIICHGHLSMRLGIKDAIETEEVESIWEKKILEQIHPDDVTEKIAWELKFHAFIMSKTLEERADYYMQHFLRFRDADGQYHTLRHRIFYLKYDEQGNVLLTLCLYNIVGEHHDQCGIFNSILGQRIKEHETQVQTLLSLRECEILNLIAQGLASKQIADRLCISTNTVNNHRQNILRKLQSQNAVEAVGVARSLGLIDAK